MAIGLAASWQHSGMTTVMANDSTTGIVAVDIGAGCDKGAYPPPNTNTKFEINAPMGDFLALNFSNFNLPPDDVVIVRAASLNSTEKRVFRYRGDETKAPFITDSLRALSVTVELITKKEADAMTPMFCKGFAINSYRNTAQPANNKLSEVEEVCGSDDTKEAACFKLDGDAYVKSRAVIRLLIHKETGSFFCTGWLVGCEGHVLTNNHCISTQAHASATQFEFDAQGASCNTQCNSPLACTGDVRAQSATLITTSVDLDYALVKLDINWSNEYGYLTLRETGAELSERIYVPQHPSGWGKRIAMKTDSDFGKVTSLSTGGCAPDQVAYDLDTRAGSSGSPVIAWKDNAVVALHHCGGCPNTAINSYKIVNDLRSKNLLPKCALYAPATKAPTPAPTPVPAPVSTPVATPAATPAATPVATPAPVPTTQTKVDGTIFATATTTSVDYIDITLPEDADVEFDILSMEEVTSNNGNAASYVDVNGDCNAGYIDSRIILFRVNDGRITEGDIIASNSNAPSGYGNADGSLSDSDSYMFLPLQRGSYRLAVGTASMSKADAVKKVNGVSKLPLVCSSKVSNYGSYRLTVSSPAAVQVTSPGSYIGSQCSSSNTVTPYSACPYHKEAALTKAVVADGTIVRQSGSVSVDHIPFSLTSFSRVTMEVSSFGTADGNNYYDFNGYCTSAYIDPAMYFFRANTNGGLTAADLIYAGDDDDNFALRSGRHSVSFRDPFASLALPSGNYVLVVGRYPLSVEEAIAKVAKTSVDKFTPESCGVKCDRGNYLVTFGSSVPLSSLTSPNTFTGTKCTPNWSTNICAK